MVGRTAYGRKGVLKYTPQVCKNQIVTASRLGTVLDMRPQPRITLTTNNDPKFTASDTNDPKFAATPKQPLKITNKPRLSMVPCRHLIEPIRYDRVIRLKRRTEMTQTNAIAIDIHEYASIHIDTP